MALDTLSRILCQTTQYAPYLLSSYLQFHSIFCKLMTKSNAFLLVQCTVQEISLLIFYAVANESQCNSDQTSDLEKNSDEHQQNFHSPRGTNQATIELLQ